MHSLFYSGGCGVGPGLFSNGARLVVASSLLLAIFLAGCGFFDDFGGLQGPGDGGTETSSTDTDTDADTDSDTDTDTDTDTACADSDCQPPTYCNHGNGLCEDCTVDQACGTNCIECAGTTPVCLGSGTPQTVSCQCLPENPPDEDTCGDGYQCVTGSCELCNSNTACGTDCEACPAEAPYCLADGSGCVECLTDDDCRAGTTAPANSPLGVCSPEGTCTCWVNAAETWTCSLDSDCGTGFYCARDFTGIHYVCLRSCSTVSGPLGGLECNLRDTAEAGDQLVWAPMTTCFAYKHFGDGCTDVVPCSVDGAGGLTDALCVSPSCTFSCNDGTGSNDDWCPPGSTCGDPVYVCE